MNKIWFFQTFLTSIFIRLHMKANLCKTFGNWQLAQTFSFMCHWYFCVKSEPLFTAARTQQANFTWPDKITLTSSHFKRPGSKICLQNPTLWHFTVLLLFHFENAELTEQCGKVKNTFAPSPLLSEGLAAASLLEARTIRPGPAAGQLAASWPAARGARRCTPLSWSHELATNEKAVAAVYLILHNNMKSLDLAFM